MAVRLPLALFAAAVLALPGGAAALPTVLTQPLQISQPFVPAGPSDAIFFGEPAAVALSTGDFAVAWTYQHFQGTTVLTRDLVVGTVLASGRPGAGLATPPDIFGFDPGTGPECPVLAADGSGGFTLAYMEIVQLGSEVIVRSYGSDLGVHWEAVDIGGEGEASLNVGCPAIAENAAGHVVVSWESLSDLSHPGTIEVRTFDASGQPLGPPAALDTGTSPAVGIDSAGRFVVAWHGLGAATGLRAQRFDAAGTPSGSRLLIAASLADGPALSMAPEGDFAVAYTKPAAAGQPRALVLRRFAPDGTESGTPFSPGTVAAFETPRASTDRYGNFALSWGENGRVETRVFNRSLAARGGAFDVGPDGGSGFAPQTAVALGDAGRLLAVTASGSKATDRIWQVLREDTFCALRTNAFFCDTAGTGQPTAVFPFGLGLPTDFPLLGDINGDGLVDPCVHRGARFACDTARNGGTAEVKIDFGLPGDMPLLGDIDGDGRADPCVHRGNRFLCDTAHNGVLSEVKIAFGIASDIALLGDVDGDRRADPCVYRGGLFYCDTAHDGVFPETTLDLRPALGGVTAGVPLLGDVDGDGRADACLYRSGLLVCGLFPRSGGEPFAVVEKTTFGQPGDVPLLGYMGPR
jgi:hypothetical protein